MANTTTVHYPHLVEVKLRPGTEYQQDANNGTPSEMQRIKPQAKGPMPLRYFAVGRKTDVVMCPLCHESTTVESRTKSSFCETLNGWLCCLSCCFPIFALSCCFLCYKCCFNTPRQFCSKCGGYLGFQSRPI